MRTEGMIQDAMGTFPEANSNQQSARILQKEKKGNRILYISQTYKYSKIEWDISCLSSSKNT